MPNPNVTLSEVEKGVARTATGDGQGASGSLLGVGQNESQVHHFALRYGCDLVLPTSAVTT